MRRALIVVVVLLALAAALGAGLFAFGDGTGQADRPDPVAEPPEGGSEAGGPSEEELRAALSTPREDSYYPEVGDPGVDSLHHDLDLTWTPGSKTLEGIDVLTFRATRDAERFQLDLGEPLSVSSVELDGESVPFRERGDHLLVAAAVVTDRWYQAEISYAGTPRPTPVPVQRPDFSTTGWTTRPNGEVWTMQEPYGAFTWYPVNDHPSDEALYDLTITAPTPWVGVSNGRLESQEEVGATTVTRWHVEEPVASYLVTIAIGNYEATQDETASGIPVTYWTPRDDPSAVADLRATIPAVAWIEERLGPYPFSTLGLVLVPATSAMETQTMVTLGDSPYARSPAVILHELAHQWYGDQVTPSDWRDMWMNEGMAMYLQLAWQAEQQGQDLGAHLDTYRSSAQVFKRQAGPPGRYRPDRFGDPNVYYVPALMWQELRERLGDEEFWAMVRGWPTARDNQNPTRADYLAWIEDRTGEELSAFFRSWLMAPGPLPEG